MLTLVYFSQKNQTQVSLATLSELLYLSYSTIIIVCWTGSLIEMMSFRIFIDIVECAWCIKQLPDIDRPQYKNNISPTSEIFCCT